MMGVDMALDILPNASIIPIADGMLLFPTESANKTTA